MKTYNEMFLEARKRLKNAGIEAYSLEARLIMIAATGKTREEYARDMQLYAPDELEEKLDGMLARRIAGEPVAYITGEWEFYGITLNMTPDVLVPRIDTEVLAEKAIEELNSRESGARVLDMCCGSGCVGMAIAANTAGCRIVLADNSAKALNVCRSNLMRNSLTRSCTCIETDALETPPMLIGKFDMIVCNPPYIPSDDIKTLDASVRDFEPVAALDGGADGLDFYRRIIPEWKIVMKEGGCMMFECGIGQAEHIVRMMEKNGYENVQVYKDTLGIDRVVKGIKGTEVE